ncbi:hypothetical protein [Yunchengibacter salinarum]|uniref:hypothetical protein n=1 Tax=Yunchengibacter salinarum TaxID=3133399 RepID=UPI0035B6296B
MSEQELHSGPNTKMLIILGILVGLAIGIGGGYIAFAQLGLAGGGKTPDKSTSEETAKPAEPEGPDNPVAVQFRRISVPVYTRRNGNSRFAGNYFIDVDMIVDGEGHKARVEARTARIQHRMITVLTNHDVMKDGSQVELDTNKVADLLKAEVNALLSEKLIHSVEVINAVRMPG